MRLKVVARVLEPIFKDFWSQSVTMKKWSTKYAENTELQNAGVENATELYSDYGNETNQWFSG